jgi:hypothetical protein
MKHHVRWEDETTVISVTDRGIPAVRVSSNYQKIMNILKRRAGSGAGFTCG